MRRTLRTKLRQREVDKFEARRSSGVLVLESDFGRWLVSAWSGSVGTPADSSHAKFGADVITFFWSARAAEMVAGQENWGRVADYLWRESGKWGQKTVPEGFERPGRAWGRWGVGLAVTEAEVERNVAMEFRRLMWELYRRRMEALRPGGRLRKPRGMDGLTVFNVEKELAIRMLRSAEDKAAAKRAAQLGGGASGSAGATAQADGKVAAGE